MTMTAPEKKKRQLVTGLFSKYPHDPDHAAFVEKAALKIFDSTASLHNLSRAERVLLSHASLLHDIGSYMNEKKHNKHSMYIVKNDSVLGEYPQIERRMLSLIVYNHRRKIHKATADLPKKERGIVLILSAILRVADSLHYTREGASIKDVSVDNSEVKITVEGVLPERLNSRLVQKKDLFVDIFAMDVTLHS